MIWDRSTYWLPTVLRYRTQLFNGSPEKNNYSRTFHDQHFSFLFLHPFLLKEQIQFSPLVERGYVPFPEALAPNHFMAPSLQLPVQVSLSQHSLKQTLCSPPVECWRTQFSSRLVTVFVPTLLQMDSFVMGLSSL